MAYTLEDIPTLRAHGWSSDDIAQLLGVPWEVVFNYLRPTPARRVSKRKPYKPRRKPRKPKGKMGTGFEPTPCPICMALCSSPKLAAKHCSRRSASEVQKIRAALPSANPPEKKDPAVQVTLGCDHPGCTERFVFVGRKNGALSAARRNKWRAHNGNTYCPLHRSKHHRSPSSSKWYARLPFIIVALTEGRTLKQIADEYGVSKQRIYQVLKCAPPSTLPSNPFRKHQTGP